MPGETVLVDLVMADIFLVDIVLAVRRMTVRAVGTLMGFHGGIRWRREVKGRREESTKRKKGGKEIVLVRSRLRMTGCKLHESEVNGSKVHFHGMECVWCLRPEGERRSIASRRV